MTNSVLLAVTRALAAGMVVGWLHARRVEAEFSQPLARVTLLTNDERRSISPSTHLSKLTLERPILGTMESAGAQCP